MEQIDSTNTACDQLERAVNRIQTLVADHVVAPELAALRARIAGLAERRVGLSMSRLRCAISYVLAFGGSGRTEAAMQFGI